MYFPHLFILFPDINTTFVLPDSGHMMAGVCAALLVPRRVADNCHVARCRPHDFAHTTSSVADNDDRGRFSVATVLQKRYIRFGHGGCAHAHMNRFGESRFGGLSLRVLCSLNSRNTQRIHQSE